MPVTFKRLLLLISLYFIGISQSTGMSTDSAAYFRCYYDELNLPQTSILQILQDEKGYLWLATGRGVYRFDGKEVVALSEILSEQSDKVSGYIPWIMIDEFDNLWLGNGYVYELDSGNLVKNPVVDKPVLNAPIMDEMGNYWFNQEDKFVRHDRQNKYYNYVEANVGQGFTHSEHYVWGTSTDGWLYRMSIGSGDIAVLKYDLSPFLDGVSTLYALDDENLLIGTKASGMWRYDIRTRKAQQIFNENYVRDIMRYSSSVYWVATENGIYIYDTAKNEVEHWKKDPHDIFAIQDHSIYSFYKDKEGGVWCGSYFRGLSYVPNSQCKFKNFKPGKKYSGLEGTVIREFCKDDDGNIWIATEDSGINCYNLTNNTFVNYSKSTGISTNNVHSLCLDGKELWCGCYDNGITVFDIDRRKTVRTYQYGDGKCNLQSNHVISILKARDGTIWVGTEAGVQTYDKSKKCFSDLHSGISLCTQLYQDSAENIWCVCTNDLICIDKNGKTSKFHLHDGSIQSVIETKDHNIWIAASSGIARLDRENNTFINYYLSEHNNATNYAYRIIEDGQGFFWISTAFGLVRFHWNLEYSYLFTTLEGLPENRFNANSAFQDSEGILYFGTINGFTSFDPTLRLPNKIAPRPSLTKIVCAGLDKSRTIYNVDEKSFEIDHTENNITFEFSSFTYTAPDALHYRYRLDPLDKDWHMQQGYSPFAYPGLSPGNYVLRIQTTDYDGKWADNEISYKIEVLPPFYASWWAKLIYCCTAIFAIIYCLWKWHEKIKRKQQLYVTEVKNSAEKEIYHAKINFFTTIVHEIFTPLTLITVPLERELEQNQSDDLQLVRKNVERLQNLCTQLLDFRKMESEQLQLNYLRTDVPDFLRSILYSFSAQIKQNGLSCEHNLDEVAFEAPIDREAFTKIISNLMNNALKYANQLIKIELNVSGDTFYLSIYNDGAKIEGADRDKIFNMFYRTETAKEKTGAGIGLAFCRTLAEMQNGSLELVENSEYTHFKLTLPMDQQIVFSIEAVSDNTESSQEIDYHISTGETVILIVEDEPELRNFLKKTLSEQYTVITAENGVQALNIIKNINVSIVVTDVMMPEMDGCDLCRHIKNTIELCGIPVIMLTARNNVESKLEGYMAGAEEYIEKPFSMKYLTARIAAIIEKKKKEAEQNLTSIQTPEIVHLVAKSDKALVERFQKLVEDNIGNDKLNISFVCDQLGVSQTTFFRKFKSVMNISPNDYIRIARIERAAAVLMEVENVRVSDVAYELGFSSPSYFTRCFIQHFGVSPKTYVIQKKNL